MYRRVFFCFTVSLLLLCSCERMHYDRLTLWYDRAATCWNEALPIGSGHTAAMVFGGTDVSLYTLNEEMLWEPCSGDGINPEAPKHLDEIRRLIFQNRSDSAELLAAQYMLPDSAHRANSRYLPAGWLKIRYRQRPGYEQPATHYRRMLCLDSALSVVTYRRGSARYCEEAFCSLADNVLAVRITCSHPEMLLTPLVTYHLHPRINMQARMRREDGGITLYVAMNTEGHGTPADIDSLCSLGYDTLKQRHIDCYRRMFARMDIRLQRTNGNDKPTDWRIKNFHRTKDWSLVELLFQYGRYLLISSSPPGAQPATLQGKWNANDHPSWNSSYTLNINTEMNYWAVETANLPECDEPLIRFTRELAESGQRTARMMYGCRGWVAHHRTDIQHTSGIAGTVQSGIWPMGGAWLCENLWRHYEFNRDTTYLASVYPVMCGAARFFLDFLVQDPRTGYMVVCPSLSPENGPDRFKRKVKRKGKVRREIVALQAGCSMDNQLLHSLFTHVAEASAVLHSDTMLADECLSMRSRLTPMQIGRRGQLQEWAWDWDSPRDKHRHLSHLWALYPGSLITADSLRLMRAARESMRWRSDYATGWSMAWKLCLWARLRDSAHALQMINNFITPVDPHNNRAWGNGGLYPNMLCAHPPFQIDGNLGFTAGIIEMIVQSHGGRIDVLPAVPKEWRSGYLKGVRLRGGKTMNCEL